jgi:hypothetical protein
MFLSRGKTFGDHSSLLSHQIITYERKNRSSDVPFTMEEPPFTRKAKFEVYGEEMIEKEVK